MANEEPLVCPSAGSSNINPLCRKKSPRLSGRVAVPVGQREYIEDYDAKPGKNMPDGYDKVSNNIIYKIKGKQPFSTYTVYKFNVYEYDTYDDYKTAFNAGTLKKEVATFELSFDVQMLTPKKGWILPHILQEKHREVAMWANKRAGKKREKSNKGFGIYLSNIDMKRRDGLFRLPGKERPMLLYGGKPTKEQLKSDPKGEKPFGAYQSGAIAVHLFGPSGSEGCSTTIDKKYWVKQRPKGFKKWTEDEKKEWKEKWKRERLPAFERDMMEWMNITGWEGPPAPRVPARIVLPGIAETYPDYFPGFANWDSEEVGEILFEL